VVKIEICITRLSYRWPAISTLSRWQPNPCPSRQADQAQCLFCRVFSDGLSNGNRQACQSQHHFLYFLLVSQDTSRNDAFSISLLLPILPMCHWIISTFLASPSLKTTNHPKSREMRPVFPVGMRVDILGPETRKPNVLVLGERQEQ